ncbi:MAG: toxin-antitoxin system YwqK family antitoxin [Saezia sp.]
MKFIKEHFSGRYKRIYYFNLCMMAVLLSIFITMGYATADTLSYQINEQTTAQAAWKPGDPLVLDGDDDIETRFLGVTTQGHYLVQTFYTRNGAKKSDPFLVSTIENYQLSGRIGNYISWYPNGQKAHEGYYQNGLLESYATSWYENGQKLAEGRYQNDKEEGLHTVWYENGQKFNEQYFKNGEPDGHWITWDETGKKTQEIWFENGKEVNYKEY